MRRRLLACLVVSGLAGCAISGDDGIGGTGATASTEGIGGTGIRSAADPEGIGGTGIIGTIAGLDGLLVNGLRVEVLPAATVSRNARKGNAADLAAGQVVAIAGRTKGDRLLAKDVAVMDAIVGPVERVDPGSGQLRVMGVELAIEPDVAVMGGELFGLEALSAGDRVRVSGLWRGASLQVTRVERAASSEPDLVLGPVTRDSTGRLLVGGIRIASVDARRLADGEYARVFGSAAGDTLQGKRIDARPFAELRARVSSLLVEDYPQAAAGRRPSLRLLGPATSVASSAAARLREAASAGRRVVVDAGIVAGRVRIEAVRPAAPIGVSTRPPLATPIGAKPQQPQLPDPTPRPILPERPILPARPVVPERPVVPARPVVPDRPTKPRPVDVRPSVPRATDLRR